MPDNNTVTFQVTGELSLERFAVAIRRFVDLIHALNAQIGEGAEIAWVLDDLQYGSATATARAVPSSDDLWPVVERIIDSYLQVGVALETAAPIPFPGRIEREAMRVKDLLETKREDITSIRFETPKDDATIERSPEPHPLPMQAWAYAYGAAEGRVQTLSSRGALRFTLYDTLNDQAVSCYLDEALALPEREAIMRNTWGKMAVVEGLVKRDRRTGRPRIVRHIRFVSLLPEPDITRFRDARGAWPVEPGGLSPEDAIRRLRDAG